MPRLTEQNSIKFAPNWMTHPDIVEMSNRQFRDAIRLMCELHKGIPRKKKIERIKRILHRVISEWGPRCAYCGAADKPLEVEHLVPLSRGGADALDNMAPACRECNQRKFTKTPAEFGVFPAVWIDAC